MADEHKSSGIEQAGSRAGGNVPPRPEERSPSGTTSSTAHREDSSQRGNEANRLGSGNAGDQRDKRLSEDVDRMVSEGGESSPVRPPRPDEEV